MDRLQVMAEAGAFEVADVERTERSRLVIGVVAAHGDEPRIEGLGQPAELLEALVEEGAIAQAQAHHVFGRVVAHALEAREAEARVHRLAVPEAGAVGVHRDRLVAALFERAGQRLERVAREAHERRTARRRVEARVGHELGVRGVAVLGLAVDVREVEAVAHEPVQVRRHRLAADREADREALEGLDLHHDQVLAAGDRPVPVGRLGQVLAREPVGDRGHLVRGAVRGRAGGQGVVGVDAVVGQRPDRGGDVGGVPGALEGVGVGAIEVADDAREHDGGADQAGRPQPGGRHPAERPGRGLPAPCEHERGQEHGQVGQDHRVAQPQQVADATGDLDALAPMEQRARGGQLAEVAQVQRVRQRQRREHGVHPDQQRQAGARRREENGGHQ
ncbi:hypothetical protein D3C72_959340 [compost metagenome]